MGRTRQRARRERENESRIAYLLFLSHGECVGQDTVELLWAGRPEQEIPQQGEQRDLDRLLLIRQAAAVFLHAAEGQTDRDADRQADRQAVR